MARKLTHKQRGFVKEYVKGKSGTKAALAVYDTKNENVAAIIASENLGKPQIIDAINKALPDELLADVHSEGLYATKGVYDDEGNRIEEDADFNVRAKYLDMAYKVKGRYAAEKHVNINVNAEDLAKTIQADIARFRGEKTA